MGKFTKPPEIRGTISSEIAGKQATQVLFLLRRQPREANSPCWLLEIGRIYSSPGVTNRGHRDKVDPFVRVLPSRVPWVPAMALARHMATLAFNFVAMMGLIGRKTGHVYDMIFTGSGRSRMVGAMAL